MIEKVDIWRGEFEELEGRSINSHYHPLRQDGRTFRQDPTGLIGRELSVDEVIKLLKREIASCGIREGSASIRPAEAGKQRQGYGSHHPRYGAFRISDTMPAFCFHTRPEFELFLLLNKLGVEAMAA